MVLKFFSHSQLFFSKNRLFFHCKPIFLRRLFQHKMQQSGLFNPVFLIVLLAGLSITAPGFADDSSSEDWPAYVDPPPQPKRQTQVVPTKPKKKFSLFGKKKAPSAPPATAGNQSPNALSDETKPLDVPAKPFPLLRLPRTIQTPDGQTLEPGIYLGAAGGGLGQAIGAPPPDPNIRTLTLLQRNEPRLTIQLTVDGNPDANGQSANAPSPIQKIDPKAPPLVRLEAVPSINGDTVTFIWKEDNQRFKSQPYAVITDTRPVLKY
jgi:hypothetical protein